LSPQGGEEMAAPTTSKVDVKGWIVFILTLIVFIGGTVWTVGREIHSLDKRTTKIEIALKLLTDSQGGKIKELIGDALAAAQMQKDFGNEQASSRLLRNTQQIIAEEKNAKAYAPPEFFADASKKLGELRTAPNPAISQAAHEGMVTLANYRSAIAQVPEGFQSKTPVTSLSADVIVSRNGRIYIQGAFLSGNAIDNSGGQGFDIDNTILENVVLQNVKIVYNGGPISLRNVHFVNCEITATNKPQGDLLLAAISQNQPFVSIS
jgi:hypothetical protein